MFLMLAAGLIGGHTPQQVDAAVQCITSPLSLDDGQRWLRAFRSGTDDNAEAELTAAIEREEARCTRENAWSERQASNYHMVARVRFLLSAAALPLSAAGIDKQVIEAWLESGEGRGAASLDGVVDGLLAYLSVQIGAERVEMHRGIIESYVMGWIATYLAELEFESRKP